MSTTTPAPLSASLPEDLTSSSRENSVGQGAIPVPNSTPERAEPPEVVELRRNRARLWGEIEAARVALPRLSDAVASARTLARERAIEAKIAPSEESRRQVQEAQDRLARALESEALTAQEIETLGEAFARASKALEVAAAAAAREDARIVRAVMGDPAALDRVKLQLRDALDHLYLVSRLKGAPSAHAQALVADALGTALTGEAMWSRSVALFDQVLGAAKAKGGTA